ncbi:unnamed protein product [Adineta ricciae]|uniref:Uncharacterized protein n=1 Tax=Adineta ricciae TaxID=249248 RepID=A0A815TS07_ADIRI|nr:unnamed protein product [Adineta ricciae]CAF1504535.1 unnamed protein product [Adineta ricciae]
MRYLFYFILLRYILNTLQFNLYYTDDINENEDYQALQYNCLRFSDYFEEINSNRDILTFCLNEFTAKFSISNVDSFPKFTFNELSKENISSEQLYNWHTPIDIIERYQSYLNQSFPQALENEIVYNCTLPRFGPVCQYDFENDYLNFSNLQEMMEIYYENHEYNPSNLSCYIHMQCDRGLSLVCLDWTEICDGIIDCFDDGIDEKYCTKLEFEQWKKNFYGHITGLPSTFDNKVPSNENEEHICDRIFLTSSCSPTRFTKLIQMGFFIKYHDLSMNCWLAFKCIFQRYIPFEAYCNDYCVNDQCITIIEEFCPDMIFISDLPFFFDHFYLAYLKSDLILFNNGKFRYPHICYNGSKYDDYFDITLKILFNNASCYGDMYSTFATSNKLDRTYFSIILSRLLEAIELTNTTSFSCTQSDAYQCINSSKCISIESINDYIYDCPHKDDEQLTEFNDTDLIFAMLNGCGFCVDDGNFEMEDVRKYISFRTICDGYTILKPKFINGRRETDETECEHWECNNIYTRCNHFWNCLDGADEVGCRIEPTINCSSNEHICISSQDNKLICISLTKMNDGVIDCLGAMDEFRTSRQEYREQRPRFYCQSQNSAVYLTSNRLCNGVTDCDYNDDERVCNVKNYCNLDFRPSSVKMISDIQNFLCKSVEPTVLKMIVYFTLDSSSTSDLISFDNMQSIESDSFKVSNDLKIIQQQSQCHRGLSIRTWLDNEYNQSIITCFCPLSYYGDQCQYQNQRVTLGLRFRSLSDSIRTLFVIIISLIDQSNKRIVHSVEQFTYLSVRDCNSYFINKYTYSTRPKNEMNNYSIHIDIYEQDSFIYRASLLFPILSQILPVYSMQLTIDIPKSESKFERCANHRCIHGKCLKYTNNQDSSDFCQCTPGWTGQYCHIPFNCTCSSDSLCIGITASQRSICVCPIHKFGPRCYLQRTICQTNIDSKCQHGGTCIPFDEYRIKEPRFMCICPIGFSGDRCEILDLKIILSFEISLLSQSIFVHFIEIIEDNKPIRTTTFQTISFVQNLLTIAWSQPFHLVFIEIGKNNYYLTVVDKTYNRSRTINKIIQSSDRCPYINELFNKTIVNLHLLRRIKYYHIPCRDLPMNLSCFYDDIHLCICYQYEQKRLTNCFEFNHSMTFDCEGQNACKNGGQCFQDSLSCLRRTMCLCSSCYYGQKCQFTSSGFGLTLDNILGYHIRLNMGIQHQTNIVKVSIVLNIIFIIVGFINGILALITFKNKVVREVGCGLYLLGSSITTLLIVFIFAFKFWILIFTQMLMISNEVFLRIQCISLDFFIQICLNMDQWLNACVACERAMTIIKGVRFKKDQSRNSAKKVIIVLLIFCVLTSIHDPINRHIIHEEHDNTYEKRIWCIVTYSSRLQIYNSLIHTFQFFVPFILNFISAVILITKKTNNQSNLETKQTRLKIFMKNCRQHQHLLIAPVVLVILSIPRLIISFVSKCMKTNNNDVWLYLMGYFISFISPVLTFVIFIVPSKFYRKEFRKSVVQYRTLLRKRFGILS